MMLAHVWRWLCNCSKFEHGLNDKAQLWKIKINILDFKLESYKEMGEVNK
jgi:hypothetical protein